MFVSKADKETEAPGGTLPEGEEEILIVVASWTKTAKAAEATVPLSSVASNL